MDDQPYQRGLRISVMGLFVNAALGVVKLLAGLLGRSTALVLQEQKFERVGGTKTIHTGTGVPNRWRR